MSLVSTEWLSKNLDKVSILDGSWHLDKNRNALEEYKKRHIENAIFLDLNKISNQDPNLPHNHFLPKKEEWGKKLSEIGISNKSRVIIYDHSDLISSCRVWFQFLYFGHDPHLVSVLDGGLKSWLLENRNVTDKEKKIISTKYIVKENHHMIKNKSQIKENILTKKFTVLDARGKNRFLGLEEEPRPNVTKGNIEGSKNLPFRELIDSKTNKFLDMKILKEKFNLTDINSNETVMSCGSSITAGTNAMGYFLINRDYVPKIYIGSYTDWGLIK